MHWLIVEMSPKLQLDVSSQTRIFICWLFVGLIFCWLPLLLCCLFVCLLVFVFFVWFWVLFCLFVLVFIFVSSFLKKKSEIQLALEPSQMFSTVS